MKCTLIAVGQ